MTYAHAFCLIPGLIYILLIDTLDRPHHPDIKILDSQSVRCYTVEGSPSPFMTLFLGMLRSGMAAGFRKGC